MVVNDEPNAQVSDTTEDDSSNEADTKNTSKKQTQYLIVFYENV